jgi:hypothetical protein
MSAAMAVDTRQSTFDRAPAWSGNPTARFHCLDAHGDIAMTGQEHNRPQNAPGGK